METHEIDKLFAANVNLVRKVVWKYVKATGLEYDELFGEGSLAFVEACHTYDPSKATFSTWVTNRVKYRLQTYATSVIDGRYAYETPLGDKIYPSAESSPVSIEKFGDILESLSQEARQVAEMVLDAPAEFFEIPAKFARGLLYRKLRRQGWSWGNIWKSFREVKQALS